LLVVWRATRRPGWELYDRGARMKYAMFTVMDPEATEADDAAAPSIED
jgi:hypothetical protein